MSMLFQFIVHCVDMLGDWLSNYNSENIHDLEERKNKMAYDWFAYQRTGWNIPLVNDGLFRDDAELFWDKITTGVHESLPSRDTSNKSSILEKIFEIEQENLIKALKKMSVALDKHRISNFYKESCIVFAFDEAKALFKPKMLNSVQSIFHALRRSFVLVPSAAGSKNPPLIAVFTDTTSSVSNFSPAKMWDDSARVLNQGTKMFDPYSCLGTIDVFVSNDKVETLSTLGLGFAKYGRPAYYAMAEENEERVRTLIKLVGEKILAGITKVEDLRSTHAVSALGVLVVVNVNASHAVASEIVASNMRYSSGISEDRHSIFNIQLSEPVMAQAVLNLTQKYGWDRIICKVVDVFGSVVVDVGYKGELGMQIACMMAIDECNRENHLQIVPIKLETFLKTLLGKTDFSRMFGDDMVEEGQNCGDTLSLIHISEPTRPY